MNCIPVAGVDKGRPGYKRHPGEGLRLRRRRVERQRPPGQAAGSRPRRQLPRQRGSRPRQPPLLPPPQRLRGCPGLRRAWLRTRCLQLQPAGQRRRLPLHGLGEAGRRRPRGDSRKSCLSSCLRAAFTLVRPSQRVLRVDCTSRIMSSGTNDFSFLHYLGPRGFLSDSETTFGASAYHLTWTSC